MRVVDQCAEQALASGQRSDQGSQFRIDADVDELLQTPAGCQHAKRAIARIHELAGRLDDVTKHYRQRHIANDHLVGAEQSPQSTLGGNDVFGASDELQQELVELKSRSVREIERSCLLRLLGARLIRCH